MALTYGKVTENMWFGLSTDIKPVGSFADVLYETDTGNAWIWTGTTWTEYLLNSISLLISRAGLPVWNDNPN